MFQQQKWVPLFTLKEMKEIFEKFKYQLKENKLENEKQLDVFISYCWSNSHDAIAKGSLKKENSLGWLDPRSLVEFFKKNKINALIDVEQGDKAPGLFGQITKGLNEASVVIACLSDEYCKSDNCRLEFRFAHALLKKLIIKAVVGLSNSWRNDEISFLCGNYSEINSI